MIRRAVSLFLTLSLACSGKVVATEDREPGGSGAGGANGAAACPTGEGWPMVLVPLTDGRSFCIDSRETTNDQYAAFLARGVMTQHPECTENLDLTPKDGWPPEAGRGSYPVRAVNFCDAFAYCASIGKRICGDLNGNVVEIGNDFDSETFRTTVSTEMQAACMHDGDHAFAYGDHWEPGRCPDQEGAEYLLPADAKTTCEGGFDGIYFLQGNAFELAGACKWDTTNEGLDGAFCFAIGLRACELLPVFPGSGVFEGALDWGFTTGIRCCADSIPD